MQFMLKIVVCDDDALCCKEIVKGIRDTLGSTPADISDFRDPTLLLEHLRKTDCQPHIALLDICMPEQDGIRLAQSMKQYAPFCQIIFLSSYLSYATEVYETEHIYFILKSQLHQRIGPAGTGGPFLHAGKTLSPVFAADAESARRGKASWYFHQKSKRNGGGCPGPFPALRLLHPS